jgi:predicted ATPase
LLIVSKNIWPNSLIINNRSENDSRAVEYLVRAGEQALERSAFSQAATYFEDALRRLEDLPVNPGRDRKEIAIRTGLVACNSDIGIELGIW